MRYRQLIESALEEGITLREMARAMEIPPASLHNYIHWPTEPRIDALNKMSGYFGEPVSMLLSEDDDLTAQLVATVRKLSPGEKENLLADLREKTSGPHTVHN